MHEIIYIWLSIWPAQIELKSDTIFWCKERKLNWTDFKANNTPAVYGALTASKILVETIKVDSLYVFNIRSVFLSNESWSKDSSEYLLEHEQIHFDIAEVAARRVRRFLYNKIITDTNYKVIADSIRKKLSFQPETNKRFDKETGHGIAKNQQIRWRRFIDSQLKALEKFGIACPP